MSPSRATLIGASASLAAVVAVLLRREQARRSTERFAAAALETLLNAIDANDEETGAHVRRVATYALILADAADLSEHECKSIERVALFHDIGKIHEALFDIIRDEDSLTPAERRAIATHPAVGADVLEPLRVFYPDLSDGVLAHHERWDGSGYPRGLKGRRIPLSARVVTIADTFDAITSRRPYHSGQSTEVARKALIDGRGTQFDPELVDLFLFPPVYERVTTAERAMEAWDPPVQKRRAKREDENVPDITFRWRPQRPGSHERQSLGPTPQTAR
jgi:HD-GYP domain-containing protein (c-di-GMP phosphodiesterase class II)